MLSIIIPTDNGENSLFQESLKDFVNRQDLEIILVSQSEAVKRAERLNIGFHRSKGEVILFHHPRTKLPKEAIEHLIQISCASERPMIWGGFIHQFDKSHFLLRFISWYSNFIRLKWQGIVYLDHCIFFDRKFWKSDLSSEYLFEDTELSIQFRKIEQPVLLPYLAITSAHRFEKNGILQQAFINQILKLGYFLRLPSSFLFSLYQR
ncbi:glycosyltransferase [Leptospira perdikensis]|uniref:Glycosyltransferase n=1 Tax=Leptospira perdikensis TaxID=2484948 RepID=A0A4R9JFP3_9LEPT|nr:glycosyltransferase [Leptospira perdikensis]TGL40363.1 glycosyltransferase [Leptospira perdikensis]